MKELIVETFNREALDKILQSFGGVVAEESCGLHQYQVRSINGNIDYVKFIIQKQGYARIIREQEIEVLK